VHSIVTFSPISTIKENKRRRLHKKQHRPQHWQFGVENLCTFRYKLFHFQKLQPGVENWYTFLDKFYFPLCFRFGVENLYTFLDKFSHFQKLQLGVENLNTSQKIFEILVLKKKKIP
jgi:hypothetical protein